MSIKIVLNHVEKNIKKKEILHDVCAEFLGEHIYGIVGPNASGKTMLLRAIAGFLYLDGGEVIKEPAKLGMGVIIEDPAFLHNYTGLENLNLLSKIKKQIDLDCIRRTMLRVGLNPDDKRKVKEYSLGMKQKLAVAQAVMESPELLLLDEPTRALDSESLVLVRKVILEEKQRGACILIASHNPDDIKELCDKVYGMNNGHLMN